MIQEILDYLLIRSFLLNSNEKEIIDSVTNEEEFAYVLNNIYNLMQEEDFVLISSHLSDKVLSFISKYRFDYIKNKDYCDKMNYIIGRLHNYKNMSIDRKKYIVNNWIEEESKTRGLPKCYQNGEDLFSLISLDMKYLMGMISIGEEFVITNVVEYVSLINIIMNKFPECFEDDHLFLEVARNNLNALKKVPFMKLRYLKMIKDSLNKLNENYTVSTDVQIEKQYSLKKTKK